MLTKRIPGDERRELILEAALEVFSEKGYKGSTITHIAEKAGINRGLIYHYFTNKEDLYKSIIGKAPGGIWPSKKILEKMKNASNKEFLKLFARSYLKTIRSNKKLVKFINLGQLENPRLFELQFFREGESPTRILASFFKTRMQEKKSKRMKAYLVARMFVSTIHWYGVRAQILKAKGWKAYREEEVLDTIVEVYLDGLDLESLKKIK